MAKTQSTNSITLYNAILERAENGVTRIRGGKEKIVMKPLPVIEKIQNILRSTVNVQTRWTSNSSIYVAG